MRIRSALLALCLLAGLVLPANAGAPTQTTAVQLPDNTATLTLSDQPIPPPEESVTTLRAGTDPDGQAYAALVHIPLPAGILAEDVEQALLEVKPTEGASALHVGAVRDSWTLQTADWALVETALPLDGADAARDGYGWVQCDVTEAVRLWLSGAMDDNGLVLTHPGGGVVRLASAWTDDPQDCPRLVIRHRAPAPAAPYGRFGYAEQQDGNCLSYALRDLDAIYLSALTDDTGVLDAAYAEGGLEGALECLAGLVERYVQAHAQALGIASFTRLDAYDSPIDAGRAYRVALRVGVREGNAIPGIQMGEEFDYHLRMQLADGSWAEKMPRDPSRPVPGSNAALDPSLYPWDSSTLWGYEKWADYYTSQTLYYAVEKTGDGFTRHLNGQE